MPDVKDIEYGNLLEQAEQPEQPKASVPIGGYAQQRQPQEQAKASVPIGGYAQAYRQQAPEQPTGALGAFGSAVDWWREHVDIPVASTLWGLHTYLPGYQSGEETMQEAQQEGAGWWQAAREGYLEGTGQWGQFGWEMANPLYWLPLAGWGARGASAAAKGIRGASALGRAAEPAAKAVETVGRLPLQAERAVAWPITKAVGMATRPVAAGLRRLLPKNEINDLLKDAGYRVVGDIGDEGAGIAIPPIEHITERLLRPSSGRRIAQGMAKLPVIGRVNRTFINLVDRTALIESEVEARVMAENIRANYATRFIPDSRHRLERIGNQWEIWGTREINTPEGPLARNVKVREGQSPYIGDILENYTQYDLTPKQLEWAKEYHAIHDEWLEFLARENIVDLEQFKDVLYAHRQGLGKMSATGEMVEFGKVGAGAGRTGRKIPALKERVHPTQAEGVAAGIVYNPNQVQALQSELTQLVKILRDTNIKNYMLPLGKTQNQWVNKTLADAYTRSKASKEGLDYMFNALKQAKHDADLLAKTPSRRKVRVPSGTVNAIKRRNPALAEEMHISTKMSRAEVEKAYNEVKALQEIASTEFKEVKGQYTRMTRRFREGGYDPTKYAIIKHPAFNGRVFEPEVAKAFKRGMGEQGEDWIKAAGAPAAVSRTMRSAVAALDLSYGFIQGLPLLGYAPHTWANLMVKQLSWLAKPQNLSKSLQRPDMVEVANFWRKYGLYQGSFEYFAGVGTLERIGGMGGRFPAGRGLVRQTYGRAEVVFSGFGDLSRLELAKAMRPLAKNEDDLYSLARLINEMTGVVSPVELGIPTLQQLGEQSVIFAPRYLRGGFYMVANVFSGGLTGQVARESLGHLMTGGAIVYYKTCLALGQEPVFDPRSAKFMTVQAGNQRVGVGAFITSLMRFTADVATSKPEDYVFWPQEGEEAGEWATRVRRDNPFLKFMYSKASPLISGGLDAIYHRNYFGEEFETPADWARWVGDMTLPIALQSVLTQEKPANLPAFTAEVAGMRTYPMPAYEELAQSREQYAQSIGRTSWDDLTELEKQQAIDASPDLAQWTERADVERVKWGDDLDLLFDKWGEDRERVQAQYESELTQVQNAFDADSISGYEARQRFDKAADNRRFAYQFLQTKPDYAPVIEALAQPDKVPPRHTQDVAYDEYVSLMYGSDLENPVTGEYNFEEAQRRKDEFRAKWGDTIWDYVQERLAYGKTEPPLLQELRKAREVLAPYWEIKRKVLERLSANGISLWELEKRIQEIENQNPDVAKTLRDRSGITEALKVVHSVREQLRARFPQMQYYLDKFYVMR